MVPRRFWFALVAFLSLSSQLLQAAPPAPPSSTGFSTGSTTTDGSLDVGRRNIAITFVVAFTLVLCGTLYCEIDEWLNEPAANSVAKQTTTATTSQVESTSTTTTITGVA